MYFKKKISYSFYSLNLVLLMFICSIFLSNCSVPKILKPSKVNTREQPANALERARRNVEEGRGVSLKGAFGGGSRSTNYEFSTSNPMWRSSLEILDFLPLTTVDYSGGIIITDWYNDSANGKDSIKITVRFLSNEVRSDSLKIIVHKKVCETNSNCKVSLLKNSKISEELRTSIIRQAALLEKELKN